MENGKGRWMGVGVDGNTSLCVFLPVGPGTPGCAGAEGLKYHPDPSSSDKHGKFMSASANQSGQFPLEVPLLLLCLNQVVVT